MGEKLLNQISPLRDSYLNRAKEIEQKFLSIQDDATGDRGGTYISDRLGGRIRPVVHESFSALINLISAVFGEISPQYKHLVAIQPPNWGVVSIPQYGQIRDSLLGINRALISELEHELPNLFRTAAGSTFGDFISAAKTALDEGYKDVAAVLASAAYEDVLKQKAMELGLDVEGQNVEDVIGALKSKSFFQGSESKLVSSFIRIRNHAMHAEWNKFDSTGVGSLIAYVEQFLIKHY